MDSLVLENVLDMHLHLRQERMLEAVLAYSALPFAGVLAMPNLNPPLLNVESVLKYRDEILSLARSYFTLESFKLNGENGLKTSIFITKDSKKLEYLKGENIESKKSFSGNITQDSKNTNNFAKNITQDSISSKNPNNSTKNVTQDSKDSINSSDFATDRNTGQDCINLDSKDSKKYSTNITQDSISSKNTNNSTKNITKDSKKLDSKNTNNFVKNITQDSINLESKTTTQYGKNKKTMPPFSPLMSLYISDDLSEDDLKQAAKNNIKILKLYPKGATTNSADGLSEILSEKFLKLLESAEKLSFILSIHGETNGFSMQREKEFLPIFSHLARTFPRLKIIIEHLSDAASIDTIEKHENLYGTITLHHMLLSLDDIVGGKLNAFAFCKPIVKTPRDRDAILATALSAHPKFSFGSDSAPHSVNAKLAGAAGIFAAPTALQGLCDLFDKHKKLENLQKFLSDNAQKIYNLKFDFKKRVKMVRKPCAFGDSIPCESEKIAVFLGQKTLNFSIENISIE